MDGADWNHETPPWYRRIHKLIRCHPQEAARSWAKFGQEKRVEVVWLAAKRIHLDVLEWALLLTDG